jgi:hypothetical protein
MEKATDEGTSLTSKISLKAMAIAAVVCLSPVLFVMTPLVLFVAAIFGPVALIVGYLLIAGLSCRH